MREGQVVKSTWHRILIGDVLDGLRSLEAGSCRCCVTSPPYWGLRDYGVDGQIGLEATPEEYVARIVAVFGEVRRVLADDGTLWLNLGDGYNAGTSSASKPSKSADVGGWTSRSGESARSLRLNVIGLKPKDLCGIPWMVAFALRADGWYLRSDIIWHKPNPMPESVTDRPTKAHEYIFLLSKSERYFYDADAIAEPATVGDNGSSFVSDYDLQTKPGLGRGKRTVTMPPIGGRKHAGANGNATYSGNTPEFKTTRNARSVWKISTQAYAEAHFATFPEELPRRCIKAGSTEGDTVLDPFCGSGTTLAVARQLGRNGIGCELNPEYAAMAEDRIGTAVAPNTYVKKRGGDGSDLFMACRPADE